MRACTNWNEANSPCSFNDAPSRLLLFRPFTQTPFANIFFFISFFPSLFVFLSLSLLIFLFTSILIEDCTTWSGLRIQFIPYDYWSESIVCLFFLFSFCPSRTKKLFLPHSPLSTDLVCLFFVFVLFKSFFPRKNAKQQQNPKESCADLTTLQPEKSDRVNSG